MKRFLLLLVSFGLLAPAVAEELVWTTFVSQPAEAQIRDYQGEVIGVTGREMSFKIPKDLSQNLSFTLSKEGYYPIQVTLTGRQLQGSKRQPPEGQYILPPHFATSIRLNAQRYGVPILLGLLALGMLLKKRLPRLQERGESAFSPFPKIEGYEIAAVLGEGGMSTVYRARREGQKEEVAIKVLRADLCADQETRARFQREVQATKDLQHPNLPYLYDWGETSEGTVYLVSELLKGETLEQHLKRSSPLPLSTVRSVLGQIGAALSYLHQRDLVHRDVKPANIFLGSDHRVKLLDLGIARGLDLASVTRTGQAMGTPSCMAPEQTRGEFSPASDQYSLGVVAFEMLTGQKPFVGQDPMQVMFSHLQDPVPSLLALRPDLPPLGDQLVRRMLSKKPEERFSEISEAVQLLDEALTEPNFEETVATDILGPQEAVRRIAPSPNEAIFSSDEP